MASKRKSQSYAGVRKSPNAWTTDKKSRIRNSYGVLERSAWIWRIVGIFPLTIERPMGIVKYKVNKFYAAYSALICCACIGNYVYGLKVFIDWTRHSAETDEPDDVRTTEFTTLLCLIIATVWRIFCHKEMSEIINTIADQDSMLEKMNCSVRYESNARIVSAYVSGSSISAALLLTYDLYASTPIDGSLTIWRFLEIVSLMIQILDQTIFVSLVGLLGIKFRAINQKLIDVVMRANSSPPKIIVTSYVCAENLRKLAKAHYNVCAIGKRINKFFALEVILNVMAMFMTLNKSLFSIFIEVQREVRPDLVLIGTYVEQALIHTVPITIIVAICNWTSKQSADTGKLIHLTRVDKIESRLYEAVKTFSLQLHHQKLEFSAGGLFPVDSRLIQKIIADTTAYLVFLIQVQTTLDTMFMRISLRIVLSV